MPCFLQVCPSLLVKKDRGRPSDPKAKPKAYGEVDVVSNIPDLELLQENDDDDDNMEMDHDEINEDGDDIDNLESSGLDDEGDNDEIAASDDEDNPMYSDDAGSEDGDLQDDSIDEDSDNSVDENDGNISDDDDEGEEEDENLEEDGKDKDSPESDDRGMIEVKKPKASKRKFSDFNGQLTAADTSLRALKRLAEEKLKPTTSESEDGILSNEDFQRIKELKV